VPDTATPPPPPYAPTAGLPTTWWSQPAVDRAQQRTAEAVERIGQLITETPEDRRARQHAEREAAFKAAGETPEQRKARHKAERKQAKRTAARKARKAKTGDSGRARRFRRWCTLTAISASAGYAVGLVQVISPGGPYVGLLLAGFGYALDLRLRNWGGTRVSEVRRFIPLAALVICRVPVASGLTVALGAQSLITAVSHAFH
jgi:hypothetical protein